MRTRFYKTNMKKEFTLRLIMLLLVAVVVSAHAQKEWSGKTQLCGDTGVMTWASPISVLLVPKSPRPISTSLQPMVFASHSFIMRRVAVLHGQRFNQAYIRIRLVLVR